MRLLRWEIRKLLTIRLLVVFAFIFFIVYFVRLGFEFEAFPNGRPSLDLYQVTAEMTGEYGNRLNAEEFQDFKEVYEDRVAIANEYLQSREDLVSNGIETYAEFISIGPKDGEAYDIRSQVMFEEKMNIFWELEARRSLVSNVETADEQFDQLSARQDASRQALTIQRKRMENGGIFPYDVMENYNRIMQYLSVIVILGTVILISPIFLRDKMNHMQQLQYTTRTGRRLFKAKIWAALIVAVLLTTFTLAAVFALYAQNDTAVFFSSPINSLFSFEVFWFNFTFIGYIVLTVSLVYVLSLCAALAVAALSRIVPNYMTLIGGQVPVVILIIWLLLPLLIQNVATLRLPVYFTPVAYGSLVVLSAMLIWFSWHREKRRDIL